MNKISHNLCNRQFLTKSFSVAATMMFAAMMVLSIVPTGNGMQTAAVTAVAVSDMIAPTVISTVPVNAVLGVAINSAITATFSEGMAPLTISKTTFTLNQGVVSITGSVTYSGVTATFKPTVNLADNTAYTATITTGVKDLAGNAMAVNKVWAFTTGNVPLTPVDLGSASNFVILAKAGVSSTGTTAIVGNIGVSPIAATGITGFGLIMDSSNQFSTSSLVTGKIYTATYAPPTPSVMTTAISNMQTAYTNAAGRVLPDYTELGAGNIGGMTLAPGLYKWSSGVIIPTDVTLSGNTNSVWIFQIAQTLDISAGKQVILSGGAQASNIFWQVAGQTTIGTTAVFNGNILDQTAIVLQTGATLNGRAMAQTAVTLDANAVKVPTSVPASTGAPTVISTIPANAAKNVGVNCVLTATFSEGMSPQTINKTTVFLEQGGAVVSGTVTYSGVTATFKPTVNLAYNTAYTATITSGVKDLAGNAMVSNYTWTFITVRSIWSPHSVMTL